MPSRSLLPPVTLCADDFAISPETSRTIAQLARSRCLNAISCMAAAPGWPQDARMLEGIEGVKCGPLGRIQVGLHLVLTSERPLGPMSCVHTDGNMPGPDLLLGMALAGRFDPGEFMAEIDRQFVAFKAARGMTPDFVDAHQHVHVYPRIRYLVIAAAQRHAPGAWVRVPSDRLSAMLKRPFPGKAIGSSMHSMGFRRALTVHGLQANRSFAGHYDFNSGFDAYLPHFFDDRSPAHLVMCHPGGDDVVGDSIARARINEARIIGAMTLEERVGRYCRSPRHR